MSITVRITKVYGNQTIYPVCKQAKLFAEIAGTSALTTRTIAHIKLLGYTVNVQASAPATL
jgi:hypothetical protein